jgi:hypothetical protein
MPPQRSRSNERHAGANGANTDDLRYSGCSPAVGTEAAAEKRDFGTSRWQLSDEATPFPAHAEAGPTAHAKASSTFFQGGRRVMARCCGSRQRDVPPAMEL